MATSATCAQDFTQFNMQRRYFSLESSLVYSLVYKIPGKFINYTKKRTFYWQNRTPKIGVIRACYKDAK